MNSLKHFESWLTGFGLQQEEFEEHSAVEQARVLYNRALHRP